MRRAMTHPMIRPFSRLIFPLIFTALVLLGCARGPAGDTLAQWSTIDALLAGAYDGQAPCADVLRHGDFGLGTFDKLDGEMVVLDGVIYQVRGDGSVHTPPPGATATPFAAVCRFRPEAGLALALAPGMEFAAAQAAITRAAPNQNVFAAVRVTGTFARMKTRSVPAQEPPYRPLAEVVKEQSIFEMENVRGTMVGLRCPAFVSGVNVPGYHFHFISDDRARGGHVLDFMVGGDDKSAPGKGAVAGENGAKVEIDLLHRLVMILPEAGAGLENLDLAADRRGELHAVEK